MTSNDLPLTPVSAPKLDPRIPSRPNARVIHKGGRAILVGRLQENSLTQEQAISTYREITDAIRDRDVRLGRLPEEAQRLTCG